MELPVCPLTGKPCVHPQYTTVTDITQEGVKSVKLCNNCVADYIGSDPQEIKKVEDLKVEKPSEPKSLAKDVFDFLETLIKATEQPKKSKKKKEKPPCPSCGITVEEIAKHKRLGCPHCYDHFGREIDMVLQNYHGATYHVGKVPKNQKIPKLEPEDIVIRLKRKLDVAIAKEDYEAAAILRDEIKRAEDAKMQREPKKEKEAGEETSDEAERE